MPKKIGRPTKFTAALAETICRRLMEGESLRAICRDEAMPAIPTVYGWLHSNAAFAEQYARARQTQADTLVDEILTISDDHTRDTFTDAEGNTRTDHEHIQRSRLRVDTRKWLAAKVLPRKYGDKLGLEHSGEIKTESEIMREILARVRPSLGPPSERRDDTDIHKGDDDESS